MSDILSGLRVTAASMTICVVGYAGSILSFAQVVTPATANGSLLTDDAGTVIGSRQIAQAFTRPGYVWPRPSAVDYAANAAGGSNLSPANPAIGARAADIIAAYGGASATDPIPADLVTASGAGLDPHISLDGALFQADRVAAARGLSPHDVRRIMQDHAIRPGGALTSERIVNVLALNLALDDAIATADDD